MVLAVPFPTTIRPLCRRYDDEATNKHTQQVIGGGQTYRSRDGLHLQL